MCIVFISYFQANAPIDKYKLISRICQSAYYYVLNCVSLSVCFNSLIDFRVVNFHPIHVIRTSHRKHSSTITRCNFFI